MNNKILLFVVGALLLGGVFVLSKNQSKVAPPIQDQQKSNEVKEEGKEEVTEEEAMEKDEEAANEDMEVAVTEAGFEPQTITVKAGTKVVWENDTEATVDVSSAQHPTHLVYPPLNLGNFEAGKTVELVFAEPGTHKYHNHLDPSKFGTVVVE